MNPAGAVSLPSWDPHPDVWLVVGLLAAAYAIAVLRHGPEHALAGRRSVSAFQLTCYGLGLVATWVASDWPVHDVAERFNYSVHMVQHLTFSMIAAPLLLLGLPAWMLRGILRPEPVFRVARFASRFLPALVVFNLVLVLIHWPAVVDASLRDGLVHFGVHVLVFVTSFVVWMPVLSPLPEIPRLAPPSRMVFLFLQSIVPTVPASFLTYGSAPLYRYYEGVPHLWGLSALDDQRLAGLIMKIGAGILLWMVIAVVFFRWAAEEERRNVPRRAWHDLDRELSRQAQGSA